MNDEVLKEFPKFNRNLALKYVKYKEEVSSNFSANVNLCAELVKEAYRESYLDIKFVSIRRLPNGVGRCLTAGILLWRFSRINFIRFHKDVCLHYHSTNNSLAENFMFKSPSFEVALKFVLEYVLRLNAENIIKDYYSEFTELEHLIRKRHINQESTALLFKTICKNIELTSNKQNCCII